MSRIFKILVTAEGNLVTQTLDFLPKAEKVIQNLEMIQMLIRGVVSFKRTALMLLRILSHENLQSAKASLLILP